MQRLWSSVAQWLARPQRTRGDDLLIAVLGAALLWLLGAIGGRLLGGLGLVSFHDELPIWGAAVAGGACLGLGTWIGRRVYLFTPQTQELYSEHLDDALNDLRLMAAGEYPEFSLRDYIENGIFEPAHRLLTTRGRNRGDVRFSVLHPSEGDASIFRMRHDDGTLYPALGHSMEGRQHFSITIDDSFSGYAFRMGKTQVSNDVENDDRWRRHERARTGRDYGSMISVPLIADGGKPDGVLNVLATRTNAYDRSDQTYITLLGSVLDLARTIADRWSENGEDVDDLDDA